MKTQSTASWGNLPSFIIDSQSVYICVWLKAITTFLNASMKRFISGPLIPLSKVLNHLSQYRLIASYICQWQYKCRTLTQSCFFIACNAFRNPLTISINTTAGANLSWFNRQSLSYSWVKIIYKYICSNTYIKDSAFSDEIKAWAMTKVFISLVITVISINDNLQILSLNMKSIWRIYHQRH